MTRRAVNASGELLEAAWQGQVIEFALLYGWLVYHPPDNVPRATRSGRVRRQAVEPGYPDLTLVRAPELLFVELKTDSGRVSPAQRAWLAELERVGASLAPDYTRGDVVLNDDAPAPALEVHVWRPRDWPTVEARLKRGRQYPTPRPACA